jgi:ceramide glucosyltransferase
VSHPTTLLFAPTMLSLVLYLSTLAIFFWTLRRGRRNPVEVSRDRRVTRVRVSVLKPLSGVDDELAANLDSFARLDHLKEGEVELLFGVARADDPAAGAARTFLRQHAGVRGLYGRLIVTDPAAAVNPKVAQLIALERAATGDVIVVSDSNVRVAPDYLCGLLAHLEKADLVTSVFAGTGERTLGAALENLQLGAVVLPGIALSTVASAAPLTIGKSMAMRREGLAAIGGFSSVGHVLAEDHVLGRRFHEAGMRVALSLSGVENRNVACSVRRTVERHSRWAKLRRSLVPHLFFAEPIMSPLLVATATALVSPSRTTLMLVLAVAVLQTVLSLASVRASRGHALAWKYAPLEIVRTYLLFACWLSAALTTRLCWRGHPFRLIAGSVIVPVGRAHAGSRGMVESDACVPERASSSWFPLSRKRRASAA